MGQFKQSVGMKLRTFNYVWSKVNPMWIPLMNTSTSMKSICWNTWQSKCDAQMNGRTDKAIPISPSNSVGGDNFQNRSLRFLPVYQSVVDLIVLGWSPSRYAWRESPPLSWVTTHWGSPVNHMKLDRSTHWGQDKMDSILQTTLPNAFSWTKLFEFLLKYHWSLFLWV